MPEVNKKDCPYCGAKESMEEIPIKGNMFFNLKDIRLSISMKRCTKCGFIAFIDKGITENNGGL